MQEIGILEQASDAITEALKINAKPVKLVVLINHATEGEQKKALVTLSVGEYDVRSEYMDMTVKGLTELVEYFEDTVTDSQLLFPTKGMDYVFDVIHDGFSDPYDSDKMQELLDSVVFKGSEHVSAHTEVCIYANPGYSATIEAKISAGFKADTSEKDRQTLKDLGIDIELPARDPYKMVVLTCTSVSTFPRL